MLAAWEPLHIVLRREAAQRRDEGFVVPPDLERRIRDVAPDHPDAIDTLFAALDELSPDPDFPYVEPNDLDAIRAERVDGPRRLDLTLSDDRLVERLHAAWAGRVSGCILGKPVEVVGILGRDGHSGRGLIKRHLVDSGEWPLRDYFATGDGGPTILGCPPSQRPNVAYAEPDDDIHYTLIGLTVLERHGPSFEWFDVADTWNDYLPYNSVCTAEAQALLNYNAATPRMAVMGGQHPAAREWTRTYRNPYREWIGAQIRADAWGYACAGYPELAAELAWRDASWTHTGNGIYGAMFVAAVVAAAFAIDDPDELVRIGLSEIPRRSRLFEAIVEACHWVDECADFESFMDRLDDRYASMSGVHAINNALIVVMALRYGQLDHLASTTTAVMAGLDTDCNGATVGSIAGAATGFDRGDWSLLPPLHDTIRPALVGCEQVTMADLAIRTMRVHQQIRATR